MSIYTYESSVECYKRSIDNTHFRLLRDLRLHKLFRKLVIKIAYKAIESPVGRKRVNNIEAAVMGDDEIIVKIIDQIGNVSKTLAFHNDDGTYHCVS